ncbi:MAG: phosphoribosylanthranilate isomerase [Prevotella sp.]|nr:phosphoribosylanthranilate isomerase [Prevotella sp.]
MIIKVCGMRDAENIRAVSELDIDLLGFIFWPESPRYVGMVSSQTGMMPDYSHLERTGDNESGTQAVRRVGVFVDDMPQNIVTRVYNYQLDYVQLNGSESRVMIENLRRTLDPDIRKDIKIIKAISIESEADLNKCEAYEGAVDMFLFDAKTPLVGGSGNQFDWTVLSAYKGSTPFLLSGGIGPEDVERVRSFRHPMFAGIDLNSRFETEPAVKDVDKIDTFIKAIRQG